VGELRTSTRADDDAIAYAARYWPRRDPDDFEVTGREWRAMKKVEAKAAKRAAAAAKKASTR
jgi:hypothetical protein